MVSRQRRLRRLRSSPLQRRPRRWRCSEPRRPASSGDGGNLVGRNTAMVDPVVSALCRWFRQEGREACLRCPQVTTEQRNPSELQRIFAGSR
jgi:hypothetical protein